MVEVRLESPSCSRLYDRYHLRVGAFFLGKNVKTNVKFNRNNIVSVKVKKPGPAPARQKGQKSTESKKKRKGATVISTERGVIERSKTGCYLRGPDGNEFVCGRIGFTRLVTNADDRSVSVEIKFRDLDGEHAYLVVPMSDLSAPREIVKKLMDGGLKVGDIKVTSAFLGALQHQKLPTKRAMQVSMPGWHQMANGKKAYLANGFTVTPEDGDSGLILAAGVGSTFAAKGTIEEWQEHVGEFCRGNSRLILPVCATLAAPLLVWVNHNNIGIHSFGKTSTGKTTGYYVSASLSGPMTEILGWNSTAIAFTAAAKDHNDGVAIYDDIDEAKPAEVEQVAYHQMNGRDRGRAKGDGTVAKSTPFRGVFLSNGEFDYPTFFGKAKIRISPGQLIRFLNIPAHANRDHGMFTDLHGHASGAEFVNMLKENTSRYYGTVLPEFIRVIAEKQDSIAETAKAMIGKYVKKLKRALPEGYQVTGREERVIGCFALMACAGELAIDAGVLTWEADEAYQGVRACFLAWVKHDRKIVPLTDDDIYAHLRRFFKSEAEGKFVVVADYDGSDPRPEAGYIKDVDGNPAILVIPRYFESVICHRFGKAAGIRVLIAHGLLIRGAEERPRKQIQMPEKCGGGKKNFYVIRASIAE